MCGINGIFSFAEVPKLSKRINQMNQSLLHRGPDAGAIKIFDNKIALGHRRLSIIDVQESSNQPMLSLSGRYWIVFNGEIYNYLEIRKHLENYKFVTNSDTEVILASIELYGIDWFLSHANGMFAIGVYDTLRDELIIVRDRFGVKPLYYTIQDGLFIFSSEIKGILASGLYEGKLNELAIDDYLAYRYVREPYTFFDGVYQLHSANYMTINKSLSIKLTKYWSLPTEFNQQKTYDEEIILNEFKAKFERAVALRLISDVKVGTYLSGGVDSSLISAIAAQHDPKLNTYSIGFNELNEFEFSRKVATKYKTSHHELELDNSIYLDVENWKNLISFKDSPLGVPNEIPLAILSAELKKEITVVLSGEGADELMGGYGRIYRLAFEYNNLEHKDYSFYDYFMRKYEYVDRTTRDDFLSVSGNYREEFDIANKQLSDNTNNEEYIFRFFHEYHIKGLLQRLDTTTMCQSVEGRVPFLDYELVEFVYKYVPYDLKLKWNSLFSENKAKNLPVHEISETLDTPKYLIKKLSEQYLPHDVIYRKKMGFPVPLSNWYNELSNLADFYLDSAKWLKSGIYKKLVDQLSQNERSGQLLWMFINLELFIQQYFNKTYKW